MFVACKPHDLAPRLNKIILEHKKEIFKLAAMALAVAKGVAMDSLCFKCREVEIKPQSLI